MVGVAFFIDINVKHKLINFEHTHTHTHTHMHTHTDTLIRMVLKYLFIVLFSLEFLRPSFPFTKCQERIRRNISPNRKFFF